MPKNYIPTVSNKACKELCQRALAAPTLADACDIIREFAFTLPAQSNWFRDLVRLASSLEYRAPFKIFAKGNSKLPFWAFSALPGFTCPGAGNCLSWCYSYRAWRYPGAFCRQLQNTLLLRFRRSDIVKAFAKIGPNSTVRLYVDGDFDSMSTMGFWFGLLSRRPDVQAYGYSKSLHLFLDWHNQGLHFPANYMLNMSTGGIYDGSALANEVAQLPIVRGEFAAVAVGGDWANGSARYDDKSYHKATREAGRSIYGPKAFSCPGRCGACLPKGEHACGSDRMRGIAIVIGIH